MNNRWMLLAAGLLATGCAAPPAADAQQDTTQPAAPTAPTPEAEAAAGPRAAMPGLTLHREAGYIDLDATVVTRDSEWIELLACSPGTKEYESILTVAAKPSHIHLALLTLGLKPGHPLRFEETPDDFIVRPPEGPPVAIFAVLEEDGQTREVPVNHWVVNQKTGEILEGNRFLFTGSSFQQYEGKEVYMADLNGTAVALVNFQDEVLTRDTTVTNQSDDQLYAARMEAIPAVGTELTLRLRPIKNEEGADNE